MATHSCTSRMDMLFLGSNYEGSVLWREMPHGGKRVYGGEPVFGAWARKEKRRLLIVDGKSYKIHRLICEAFHGPSPEGAVCMHLDENSRNNRADNLQWGTQKENLNAPGFIEYCKGRVGEKSPTTKFRRKQEATEQ